MSDTRRSTTTPVLLVGLVAGVLAALVLSSRRPRRPQAPEGPPIGRVGEPGPHWTVEEKALVHRSAGEVALHLHDHGGLPGLTGGRPGPAMDKLSWDLPGTGHFEAVVHGLPGADRTELTVRLAPEETGARSAAASAVLGNPARTQLRDAVEELRRRLEAMPEGASPRGSDTTASADRARSKAPGR